MLKSYVAYYLELYHAISRDMTRQCAHHYGIEKDIISISSLVESRGLRVLTIDLPDAGKLFDRSLSTGCANDYRCIGFHRCKDRRRFGLGLFQGLINAIFDKDGMLNPDADVVAIRCLRQLYNLAKKVRIDCHGSKIFKSISEFYASNNSSRRPTRTWGSDSMGSDGYGYFNSSRSHLDRLTSPSLGLCDLLSDNSRYEGNDIHVSNIVDRQILRGIQSVADCISYDIGSYDPICLKGKHGPGVVSDIRNDTKYHFPTWSKRLDAVFPSEIYAVSSEAAWGDGSDQSELPICNETDMASRLIAVPKTQKAPRLIAAEPASNQWMQQAIRGFLEKRVKSTCLAKCIDFRSQRRNQDLAVQGSVDGSICTIDLSSASDSVTCYVVERLFRKNESLLVALNAVRTPLIEQTIDKKWPKTTPINMFTTMGSAVTFPIESIIFAIIAIAACILADGEEVTNRRIYRAASKVQVFGDDIVIPKTASALLVRALSLLDFRVNTAKTFTEGNFRESCGVEAFRGTNVTPIYVRDMPRKSALESIVSSVDCAKNLAKAGYWEAARAVERTTRKLWKHPMAFVDIDSGAWGWPRPWTDISHLKQRWNASLQVWEVLVTVPSKKAVIKTQSGQHSLLQYFTEAPEPSHEWRSGWRAPTRTRSRAKWVWVGLF